MNIRINYSCNNLFKNIVCYKILLNYIYQNICRIFWKTFMKLFNLKILKTFVWKKDEYVIVLPLKNWFISSLKYLRRLGIQQV